MLRAFIFLLKTIIPLAIIFGGYLLAKHLMATGPEPQKRPPADRTPVVEVQDVKAQDYTVTLDASGIVKARTQSSLVSEVAGRIVEISPNFRPGAYLEKGELLLKLDSTNYMDAIRIAQSNIAANEAALAQLNQEERNTLVSLKLANENLQTAEKNLWLTRKNTNNVQRKAAPISKNTNLIKRNIQLARQTSNLTQKNLQLARNELQLAQRNQALVNKETARIRQLGQRRLIPVSQVDSQEQLSVQQQQAVSQKQQQILQLEQSLVQQQQSIVQQEQQLTQQDQSVVQQDENILGQQQQVLQQQQAVNQQKQTVAGLQGQMATFDSRRNSLKANNDLTRTQLLQQQRNLERTKIYAPYAGRVLEQRVDISQYVSPNAVLGVVYSTDYVEVEIPLPLSQFALLDMPDTFAGADTSPANYPKATFNVPFAGKEQSWEGYVTGTRASLNEQSRQITVVARIDKPFERSEGRTSVLKIGQYLNTTLEARTFKNVFVVPPVAVRQNKDVLQMRDNQVHIAPIEVLWTTEEAIVLTSLDDLSSAPLITTAMGQATEGMKVALPGQKKKRGGPPRGGQKPDGEGKPDNTQQPEGQQGRRAQGENQGDQPSLRDVEPSEQGEQLPADSASNPRSRPDKPAESDTVNINKEE
ncbi:MAG: Membrane fusion protein of RND family multidrug efflux pump [uncultured Thiotrichaceae bacterium]|uniref:Membrane fusion protein of RND family multidrug efflux pump n=1 Tax=uncultured Thiotrichaceae bacterium TaxID=298394 RepID=A0A6S6SED4_9GAMM|nr:MAG: Membrane fusion protein of RND family multidrug efflux pump [uncultured Thiotrichaceae bacterium]